VTIWRATGQGLRRCARLWQAIAAFVVVYSAVGAVATLVLPFKVVEGRVVVPPPSSGAEALSLLVLAGGLFLISTVLSLRVLGGVLHGLERIERRDPVSWKEFSLGMRKWFGPLIRWGALFGLLLAGLFLISVFLLAFLWAFSGRPEGFKAMVPQLAFVLTTFLTLPFYYSPFILLENGGKARESFARSFRLAVKNLSGTFLLVVVISTIGAVVYWFDVLALAKGVNAVRAALGIPAFAKGLPVFLFGLVLLLPEGFLSTLVPAAFHSYYRGKTGKES